MPSLAVRSRCCAVVVVWIGILSPATLAAQGSGSGFVLVPDDSVIANADIRRRPELLLRDPGLQVLSALKRVAESLNRDFRLPRRVLMEGRSCGKVNAYYLARPIPRVVICYELAEAIIRAFKANGVDSTGAGLARALEAVISHEAAHAIVDVMDLPALGRREDVADQFAAWRILDDPATSPGAKTSMVATISMTLLALSGSELELGQAYLGSHELALQRAGNLTCWYIGYFRAHRLVSALPNASLPAERVATCEDEYVSFSDAWQRLLAPFRQTPYRP